MDRTAGLRAVERPAHPLARSDDGTAAPEACAGAARLAPHRRRRPSVPHTGETLAALGAAHHAGASIGAVCDHIHRHEGAGGIRRILGVLALAKKHGPAVVEDAAKAALDLDVPTYRFIRRYLERRPPVPLTLRQVDPLIRQLTLYRDLIDRRTGESE